MSDDVLSSDECELCERVMPLTEHHLYPKDQHKRLVKKSKMTSDFLLKNTAMVCRPCHSAIHKTFTNKQLADRYYSIELLCEEQPILDWIEFARKQKTYHKSDPLNKGFRYSK